LLALLPLLVLLPLLGTAIFAANFAGAATMPLPSLLALLHSRCRFF
jgi:hypothetical protein